MTQTGPNTPGWLVSGLRLGAPAALAALVALAAQGASVIGSKHDLSDPSWGSANSQTCAFCHTPHTANTTLPYQAPLWNRFVDTTKTYTRYSSATLDTTPGNPALTVSGLCLGCHDGTLGTAVVNGNSGSDKHDLVNAPGSGGIPDTTSWPNCQRCHPQMYGGSPVNWLGTDLSNDHPIAMTYPTSAMDPGFTTPPDLQRGWSDVPLYQGRVECETCHAVHDPANPPFLRIPNAGSSLCLRCHKK